MSAVKKPLALIIMDGWGFREDDSNNAVNNANTPVLDALWKNSASTLISSSGLNVGLPDGQMGNSEVGHMNLGAGRIVYQNYTRITKDIEEGTFFDNAALCKAVDGAVEKNAGWRAGAGACKHRGQIWPGSTHICAALELCRRHRDRIRLWAKL